MNPTAILSLIGDLYAQIAAQAAAITEQHVIIEQLSAASEPDSAS